MIINNVDWPSVFKRSEEVQPWVRRDMNMGFRRKRPEAGTGWNPEFKGQTTEVWVVYHSRLEWLPALLEFKVPLPRSEGLAASYGFSRGWRTERHDLPFYLLIESCPILVNSPCPNCALTFTCKTWRNKCTHFYLFIYFPVAHQGRGIIKTSKDPK